MINITDKSKCSGCQACGDVCVKDAISFPADNEGFWYPKVDATKCVNCGLCEKVCPELHLDVVKSFGQREPQVYGGHHKNIAVRFDSTSGGAFSALAAAMYKQGGYVAGAVQSADDWSVTNYISNNKRDLGKLRSSKYVQSAAGGLYKRIAELLAAGEKVLACGSPCQMAALRTYLSHLSNSSNLIIVDFICRATNSPKVYAKYLEWLEAKYGSKIVSVKAKNKDHGWRSLARKVTFENGEVYYGESLIDPYRRGYHWNYYERPSCHDCKFKGFPRNADITLGDFWGIERVDPSLDHNLGTSCILVNTDKGAAFFEQARANLVAKEFTLEQVLAGNRAPLMTPIAYPQYDREAMFADLDKMSFDKLAEKYFPIPESASGNRTRLQILRSKLGIIKRIILHPFRHAHLFRWSYPHTNIDANFLRGRIFDPLKYTTVNISPRGLLRINAGTFILGCKRNSLSKLESRVMIEDGAIFEIDHGLAIGSGADIQLFPNSRLHIKSGSFNAGLEITCADSIEMGDDVHIGRNVQIRDNNGEHYIIQPGYTWHAPVSIGDHCWICSNVVIMKGVTIGEGCVISANSVVTHSIPPHCIAAGNPAEVVAENIVWRP